MKIEDMALCLRTLLNCSCRGPEFSSQCPYECSQPTVSLLLEDAMPFSGFHRYQATGECGAQGDPQAGLRLRMVKAHPEAGKTRILPSNL